MTIREPDLFPADLPESSADLSVLERTYRLILDHSPALIAYVSNDHRFLLANQPYYEFLGLEPEQVIGSHVRDVLNEQAYEQAIGYMDLVLNEGRKVHFEVQVKPAKSEPVWVSATYVPDCGPDGNVRGLFAFIQDIDALKREQQQRRLLLRAVERGIEGLALHDVVGEFVYVNPAQAHMYGYEPSELIGKSWKMLYGSEEIHQIETNHFPALMRDGQWRGELKGKKRSGELFDVEISLTLVKDALGNPDGLFCSCRDVSERKRSREEADFLAYHDQLTGLANRAQYQQRLANAIARATENGKMVAVMFIDLDHFKEVNDTLGHSVGDQVLQIIATRVSSVFRDEDIVARLGGDEFTVALGELSSHNTVSQLVVKLMDVFSEAVELANHTLFQTASVGISVFPEDGTDVDTLMKNADAAMYRAKEDGRNGHHFYVPALTDSAMEVMQLRTALRSALTLDQFELHYQPLVDLVGMQVTGFEALLRWNHPNLGMVAPDRFIGHAEESGLIVPIGTWVVEQACRQAVQWLAQGLAFERISVNVSGAQLQEEFSGRIAAILHDTGLPPEMLELEITETFIMRGLKRPVAELSKLRTLGVHLAIDDFGVGYSSLSQLKQLPTQRLKIDRSFVGDIVDDPDDRAIVEAIVGLGKTLKLQITAEGVETARQHALLRDLGCQVAQGYFYARPCPVPEITALVLELKDRLRNL